MSATKKRRCKACNAFLNSYNPYDWCFPHIPEDAEIPKKPKKPAQLRSREELLEDLREWIDENGRVPTKKDREGLAHATTYDKHFGTWAAALAEVGARPRKSRKYRAPRRDKILAVLKKGPANTHDIGRATLLSPKVCGATLRDAERLGLARRTELGVGGKPSTWELVKASPA